MIELQHVTKVRAPDFDSARGYAFRDLWWPRPARRRRGEVAIIDDVSLTIADGETLGIIGEPGAGKMVLCRLIAGMTQPSSGRIDRRGRVRLVPTGPFGTTPHMKLIEYARFLLAVCDAPRSRVAVAANEALEACGLGAKRVAKLHNVDRVELNRLTQHVCLGVDRDVYVFDRAPKVKDPEYQEAYERRLEELFATRTVIVASADPRRLPPVDRCLVLSEGRVVHLGEQEAALEIFARLRDGNVGTAVAAPALQVAASEAETFDDFGDDEMDLEWSVDDEDGGEIVVAAEEASPVWSRSDLELVESAVESEAAVIVGPFLGHSGFEGTYWVPLLRGLQRRTGLAADRTIAITQGGGSVWYPGSARTVELEELFEPADLPERIEEYRRGFGLKQSRVSPFEEQVVERVRSQLDLADAQWLSPASLTSGLNSARGEVWSIEPVRAELDFVDLSSQSRSREFKEDERYVLAWFDHLAWFPDRSLYSVYVRRVLELISPQVPVRLVATSVTQIDGIRSLTVDSDALPLELVCADATVGDRLGRIAAVLRGASVHLGTLGGGSSLAVAYGIPSVQLFSGLDASPAFERERALITAHAEAVDHPLQPMNIAESSPEAVVNAVTAILDRISG